MIVKGATIGDAIRSIFRRFARLATFFLFRRGAPRYLALTPSIFQKQILFDRNRKSFIRVEILSRNDSSVLWQIYLLECYGIGQLSRGSELMKFYKSIVEADKIPLIVDCGGNIGLATRYYSENFEEAKIICIEPDGANIRRAKKNNYSKNIDFLQSAVASEAGFGNIVDPGFGNDAYRFSRSSDGTIKIVSVNDLLKTYDAKTYTPFIIKIDIEGFEEELFSKNTEWIDKFPLLIIELHDWMLPKNGNSRNFLRSIAPLNRDFVYHGENIFSVSNGIF
ncbi:FkbM family methyltransferase [Bradyrhizobium sp. 200]|uniref:FkbM family methyltransferase n=1 Tax=Bradyrhizobium sp. 200 TaxID=2782665 RepID=UPI001FFEF74D|nr:FkbM family methyltransferase [Bradyrhizobium sp. 200]UPJ51749.1 FkbM family methyltransferase [Bradyrhizobium sp. 200]